MEEIKKKFILLSKVAREKKYAQEYLGLLARRGDIGSIRIGKRWYTTEDWFLEFLKDTEARKAEARAAQEIVGIAEISVAKEANMEAEKSPERIILPEKLEMKQEIFVQEKVKEKSEMLKKSEAQEEVKIIFKKEIPSASSIIRRIKERKIEKESIELAKKIPNLPISAQKKLDTVDLRKISIRNTNFRKAPSQVAPDREKNVVRQNKDPEVQNKQIEEIPVWENTAGNISPNFADFARESVSSLRFAFSMAMVLLLVLLFQVGWIFQDKVKNFGGSNSGIVAGAEDSNIGMKDTLPSIGTYLEGEKDGVKENISLSRVLLRAAIEKSIGNDQGSMINEQ